MLPFPRPLYLPALDVTLETNELCGLCCHRLAMGWLTCILARVRDRRLWVRLDTQLECRQLLELMFHHLRVGRAGHEKRLCRRGKPAGRPTKRRRTNAVIFAAASKQEKNARPASRGTP